VPKTPTKKKISANQSTITAGLRESAATLKAPTALAPSLGCLISVGKSQESNLLLGSSFAMPIFSRNVVDKTASQDTQDCRLMSYMKTVTKKLPWI
jgi:hypothetical protein